MAYESRELGGSLFKNDKRTDDKHPNAQGKCLIDGVEYYISAWTKEGKTGKWQSLSFKRVDALPVTPPRAASKAQAKPAPDFADIPEGPPF